MSQATTAIRLAVSLAAWLWLGPFNGFLVLVAVSSVALFVGHFLANVALPLYYRGLNDLHVFAHLIAPAVATVLVLLGIWYTIYPFPYPIVIGPIVIGPIVIGPIVIGPIVIGPIVIGPIVVGVVIVIVAGMVSRVPTDVASGAGRTNVM
ncbi:MAG: hypothetical protein ACYDH5_17465 [Acidimicrobiales bacterium]